jgi:AcrR family transcriptional regulator
LTRLPKDRDTQLTRAEIATEALRQFDEIGQEPSIRSLGSALHVAPSAIYHHYPSREAIVRAVVRRVWREALGELLEIEPRPFEVDPRVVLVACGIATRRAWLAHFRLAPYLAASPEGDGFTRDGLGLMSNLMEKLDLEGREAAAAFHSYMSFMVGSVLFAAARKAANEELASGAADGAARRFRTEHSPESAERSSDATRAAIDEMVDLSVVDPERDEEQFAAGLRKLVDSLTAPG